MSSLPAEGVDNVGALLFPAGIVLPFLGAAAPPGWYLLHTGGHLENILDYPGLFAVFGVRYGGDGLTTFGTPPAEVYLRGPDAGHALWSTVGEDTHLLTTPELPAHTHPLTGAPHLTDPGHGHGVNDPGHAHKARVQQSGNPLFRYLNGAPSLAGDYSVAAGDGVVAAATGVTVAAGPTGVTGDAGTLAGGNAGGGGAHNNMPRTHIVNLIVKT